MISSSSKIIIIRSKKNQNEYDLTDYWKTHTEKISVTFASDSVTLTGESGFYFPQPANSLNRVGHFMAKLPINISFWTYTFFRSIFNRHYDFLTTYSKAYDAIRKHDSLLRWHPSQDQTNWKELKNTVLNFQSFRAMKKIWPCSRTHILDDASIKSYFYLQLIENKIESLTKALVCEIGPGTGNLTSLFYHHFKSKLFLVDLPRTFFFSFAHLSQSCPTAKIALPHLVEDQNFEPWNYDIIMLTPPTNGTNPRQNNGLGRKHTFNAGNERRNNKILF